MDEHSLSDTVEKAAGFLRNVEDISKGFTTLSRHDQEAEGLLEIAVALFAAILLLVKVGRYLKRPKNA